MYSGGTHCFTVSQSLPGACLLLGAPGGMAITYILQRSSPIHDFLITPGNATVLLAVLEVKEVL